MNEETKAFLEEKFSSIDKRFDEQQAEIESLARAVQRGFTSVDKRFEDVDIQFRRLNERFDMAEYNYRHERIRTDRLEKELFGEDRVID